ncbi:unknown protein [Azorhizobium caulinodans ORS 571]|uniref:Uncharacterized protein n=1 Tax=Azorhizobium caulinodans (strain ATCC 43989 / DSM 5975 / JCM 20966 / LMG 6465 / NBRC 14845 / NCIMB 13405 / ORS 571) TaxID=438753 RepID=A8HTG3_AZOC5|nr:hypothetical protein [Azorhizobium caulinodans]BAF86831.1 unknown protein [Azorhizobium caulinodans ORS 571]
MSGDIVDLNAIRADELDRRWNDYDRHRRRAEKTGRKEDGIAAGKAWRSWLDLFMSAAQRDDLTKPVVLRQ